MTESEFTNTLNQLTQQVSEFTNNAGVSSTDNPIISSGFMSKIGSYSNYIYYIAVPIIIVIILILFKPDFIMLEESIDGKIPEKRLSIKKLLISTIIISIAVILLYLFYSRWKNTTKESTKED